MFTRVLGFLFTSCLIGLTDSNRLLAYLFQKHIRGVHNLDVIYISEYTYDLASMDVQMT